ncbi:MAG TPA: hypothetical protein VMT52_14050, partial [Planctomycetota bacterium]|nr:hypothetical protein [Planctomycetota bacterium]
MAIEPPLQLLKSGTGRGRGTKRQGNAGGGRDPCNTGPRSLVSTTRARHPGSPGRGDGSLRR